MKKDEEKPNEIQMYSALSFAIMLIVVGVPLWWKTTEVYRVSLPYSSIDELSPESIKIKLEIYITTIDSYRAAQLIDHLDSHFRKSNIFKIDFKTKNISKSIFGNNRNLGDLEKHIWHPTSDNSWQLVEVPGLSKFSSFYMGFNRTAYFSSDADPQTLVHVVEAQILEEDHLVATMKHVMPPPLGKQDEICSRRVSPSPAYDVVVTLLHPTPDHLDIHFNLPLAVQEYLGKLADELEPLLKFHLKSQWLHLVNVEATPKEVAGDAPHFALSEASLAHVITPLEKKLSTHVASRPVLNLVLWVPPCSSAPLHLYDNNGQRISGYDAFLSPRWGAIRVVNPPKGACERLNTTDWPKADQVMPVLVHQMKRLLGLAEFKGATIRDENIAASNIVSTWQKNLLMLSRTVEQLTIAKRTLKSLSELLAKISNIVINDEVGSAIESSLKSVQDCEIALAEGRLMDGYKLSQKAFISTEEAFTDPSLLALLYFPEDQKYAVYIPLFLPVMIPVLISFKPLFNWLRSK